MPLDVEIVDRTAALFRARLHERREALAWARTGLMNKLGVSGLGRSSVVVQQVYRLCSDELKVLVSFAWRDLARVFEMLALPDAAPSAEDMKEVVHQLVGEEYSWVEQFYVKSLSSQSGARPLRPALDAALSPVDAEIELFVAWRKRGATGSRGGVSPNIFHIYSSVGAIVTGEHAQVAVQHLLIHRAAILSTLERVQELLLQAPDLDTKQVHEVLGEVVEEVKKDQPNPLKVSGAIAAAASAIQTLASLRPAYEVLKSAAALVGISLP